MDNLLNLCGGSDRPQAETAGPVHETDLMITSRVGLCTMLERIGENHGFHTKIVGNSVYRNSNNLQDTDEVVRVMREVAQERGEREIRQRSKKPKSA